MSAGSAENELKEGADVQLCLYFSALVNLVWVQNCSRHYSHGTVYNYALGTDPLHSRAYQRGPVTGGLVNGAPHVQQLFLPVAEDEVGGSGVPLGCMAAPC